MSRLNQLPLLGKLSLCKANYNLLLLQNNALRRTKSLNVSWRLKASLQTDGQTWSIFILVPFLDIQKENRDKEDGIFENLNHYLTNPSNGI